MHSAKVLRLRLAPTMWMVLVLLLSAASWTGIALLAEYLIDRAS